MGNAGRSRSIDDETRKHEIAPLYPLAEPRPVWRSVTSDAGVDIIVDDPAEMMSGAGEIEATYTPEQLALCNAAMLAARADAASAGVEE